MKKFLTLLVIAGAFAAAEAAKDPFIMTLEPGMTPEDSTLSFVSLVSKSAETWSIYAEVDTVRFWVYFVPKSDQTPIYEVYLLGPGDYRDHTMGTGVARVDSIKANRKTDLAKATVVMGR